MYLSCINRWKYNGISGCAAKAGLRLTKVLPAEVSAPDGRMDFQNLRAAPFQHANFPIFIQISSSAMFARPLYGHIHI